MNLLKIWFLKDGTIRGRGILTAILVTVVLWFVFPLDLNVFTIDVLLTVMVSIVTGVATIGWLVGLCFRK